MTIYHQNVNVTADSRELKSSSHKQRSYSAINTLETDSNSHVKDVTVTVDGNVLLACCKYSAEVPVFKLSHSEGRVGEEKKEKSEKEKEKERLKEMEKEKEKEREKERLREREMGKEKKKRNKEKGKEKEKEKKGDKRKEREKEKEKENVNEEKEKEKEKEKGCEVAPMKPLRKKTVADFGEDPNRRTRTLGRSIANLV